jgi:hypothetical protein
MSTYKVSTVAETQIIGDFTSGTLKVGPTSFGKTSIEGVPYEVLPVMITSRIQPEAQEDWSLDNYYQATTQWLKLMVIKSTRPVTVTIDGLTVDPPSSFTWTMPPLTYYQHVFDSIESGLGFYPVTLSIYNPPASSTEPSPLPPAYPAASVEVLIAVQERTTAL